MIIKRLTWTLSHAEDKCAEPKDKIPATVPGAVQLDYAKAFEYKPYYYGLNFKQFDWMEDEYFFYESVLDFSCAEGQRAVLVFDGIDYEYEIEIDGEPLACGKGAFTPVKIDVSRYSGRAVPIKVTVFPIPKEMPYPQKRFQARSSCKPASSYGWDWHPRLVPSGIWGDVRIEIFSLPAARDVEVTYRLTDDLSAVTVNAEFTALGCGTLTAELISRDGKVAAQKEITASDGATESFTLTLDSPELWYPRGYGEQPIYTLKISGADSTERKLGFRRSKLIMNTGAAAAYENTWPRGPLPAPMQLEINGKKVFAKGSNWVNTEIFPALATPERYDELIALACDANMNIFRMWGGQYINHEYFYDKCDEMGIMLWQEFMLSCNLHPDTDAYLDTLKQEATSIIKRLRSHPSLAFWSGGNELFNSWSGMTCQSHPLRLLGSLCYELDRFTPFNMTSPLYGVTHGSYVKVMLDPADTKRGDLSRGEEFICAVKRSQSTAYTEFGCNAASPKEYILKYIMDEECFERCDERNEVWVKHHAFDAWNAITWISKPEVEYFFGSFDGTTDLVKKSIYLQNLGYKSLFEEMRRQAPLCSMAINWDFNEPWPCAAGNSLVNWPAEPKECLKSVKEALRPTILSLSVPHNRYLTGECFCGEVWLLNDSDTAADAATAEVYLVCGGEKTKIATLTTPAAAARANSRGESFEFTVPDTLPECFSISLECPAHPEMNSTYDFVHKK